jgi:O-6-methylguanine DNA methyltransferase
MANLKQKVFKIVRKIPKGKVLSYKQVAEKLGNPKLARLVGRILSTNTNPFEIPCHRVICSNGQVGGYRWGVKKKILLLKKEGLIIKRKKVI